MRDAIIFNMSIITLCLIKFIYETVKVYKKWRDAIKGNQFYFKSPRVERLEKTFKAYLVVSALFFCLIIVLSLLFKAL